MRIIGSILPAPSLNGALIEIDQESKDNFNFIFRGSLNLTRHIQLTVEGGVGERDQVLVSLGCRFWRAGRTDWEIRD